MDFSWSDEQLVLKQRALKFAQTELNDDLLRQDRESQFPREKWNKCAEFGILGLCFPKEYGGQGVDILTTILVLEGLGYGCEDIGLLSAINGQMWGVQELILTFGSEAQKQTYLPGLCGGQLIGAHGMTEPDSGSDAFSLQTKAEKRDGGYVLNGSKMMISMAPICDVAIVFATTDPTLGQWGISAFLVEKGTAGFQVSKGLDKMGLRTAPLGELVLEDCFVPEENRLGPEGAGTSIFANTMEWERGFNFSGHVGAMERQLDQAVAFVKKETQRGRPGEALQSKLNRIADMKLRLESSRLHLYRVAWLKKQGKPATIPAAMAKLYISEAAICSSLDAVYVLGEKGYLRENHLERDLRDAAGGVLYTGTSDIQRVVISRLLGL